MRPSPVTGLLSLFALLCVGIIAGVSSLADTSSLMANTYSSVLGASTSTQTVSTDPSRRAGADGGERADGPPSASSEDDAVATTTYEYDLNNVQIQLPDWYVPVVIVPPVTPPTTTTPTEGTGGAQPSVQPNDSAPRVLIVNPTTPVPQPQTVVPTITPPNTQVEAVAPTQNAVTSQEVLDDTDRSNERISDIGSSLRQFQREVRRVENTVRERVTREVESAIRKAEQGLPQKDVPAMNPFSVEERRKRIESITNKLSQEVRPTIASGEVDERSTNELEPVLKSSLDEIRLLVKADTGIDLDFSPSARSVVDVVTENNPQVSRAREELLARDGLDLYGDSDRDGISNYDERHIYNTDPLNAFTGGSSLTDGERILLGFNVLTKDFDQVPVESPKITGEVVQSVFEVHSINVTLQPLDTVQPASTSTEKMAVAELPAFTEEVTFSGRALPNSFVTLYIFSTPVVVTVKADSSGAWNYTLNTELPDGEHELYVATVDAGGRILAKSPAVPFIKRAEAAEFTPLLIPETPDVTPLSLLQSNLTLVGVVAFIVFALIALIILGVLRSGPKEPTMAA